MSTEEIKRDVAQLFESIATPVLAPATKGKTRLLKTDTGGVVTHGQVMKGLFKNLGIQIAVVEGKRPKAVLCPCGTVVRVSKTGGIPMWCPSCAKLRTPPPRRGTASRADNARHQTPRPSTRCTVCKRTDLDEINKARAEEGAALRDIGKRFGVRHTTLHEHFTHAAIKWPLLTCPGCSRTFKMGPRASYCSDRCRMRMKRFRDGKANEAQVQT